MKEPIKAGDLCEVVDGALGSGGPNIGKRVEVCSLQGEHSVYGRIWRCRGKDLVSEYGGKGITADFAQSWLRKIEPEDMDPASREVHSHLAL